MAQALRPGEVHVVFGLKSSPELNGVHVELLTDAPNDERSRIAARVLESGRKLLVRSANLRRRTRLERTRPWALIASGLGPLCYEASPDGVESNLVVLLHGLGDTAINFLEFGRRLALPQTSLLAVTAPLALPFGDMGSGWLPAFEEDGSLISEPVQMGDRRRVTALRASRRQLVSLLRSLVERCNWKGSELFLLGFSQGGTVAVDIATHSRQLVLGGVVGISCACVLDEDSDSEAEGTAAGHLLTMHGTRDEVVPISLARATRDKLGVRLAAAGDARDGAHKYVELEGGGHSTPRSAEHAQPLLSFFAARLRSQLPYSDVVELSQDAVST
jgi:predicted esterase